MRSKQGREFTPKSKREEVGLLASIVRTISQIAGDLELGTIPPVAAETGCVTVDMQKDSSRYLIRGIVPVKKRDSWVDANLRLATLRCSDPDQKIGDLALPRSFGTICMKVCVIQSIVATEDKNKRSGKAISRPEQQVLWQSILVPRCTWWP